MVSFAKSHHTDHKQLTISYIHKTHDKHSKQFNEMSVVDKVYWEFSSNLNFCVLNWI